MYDVQGLFKDPLHAPGFLVAEIGINHDGKLHKALELVDLAVRSGADAVKFQVFKSDEFINPLMSPQAHTLFQGFELSHKDWDQIQAHCRNRDILFFATPLDHSSLQYLVSCEVALIKIASSDISTEPVLKNIAATGVPVILSSGMADEKTVEKALGFFKDKDVALLYCVSEYPVLPQNVDLKVIPAWIRKWDIPIGFSDHSCGIELSEAAVTLGAKIIERHFTDDKCNPGADHAISLDPTDFSRMAADIRNIESALGPGIKTISKKENKILPLSGKGMYAARNIKKGEIINEKDIFCMRPGPGVSMKDFQSQLGKKAERDFALYEKV